MKKTEVIIHNNETEFVFCFSIDKETFMNQWNDWNCAVGYFSHVDEEGNEIVINPSHCGIIEISEINV